MFLPKAYEILHNYSSVLLWIIMQCHLAIFKLVAPHRHFLKAEKVLAVNTH
jgi:hypothetical protein